MGQVLHGGATTTAAICRARHLADFVNSFNFGRRLKTLKGLTPYEAICKTWTTEPKRFTLDPIHQMPGLNI